MVESLLLQFDWHCDNMHMIELQYSPYNLVIVSFIIVEETNFPDRIRTLLYYALYRHNGFPPQDKHFSLIDLKDVWLYYFWQKYRQSLLIVVAEPY